MPRDHEPLEDDAPVLRRRGPSFLGPTLRVAFASAIIAWISLCARQAVRAPVPTITLALPMPSAVSAKAVPAPVAPARLGLAEPGVDPVRVAPGRLDPATGLREDPLSRGAFEALEAPVLRLTLTRGAGAGRAPGLFVLLARRAAGGTGPMDGPALAVVRTGAYGRIATKFGAVETLEATLAGPLRRTCTGFVTRDSPFRIDGWLCAPLGRAPEPRALACTLDALSLEDPADPASAAAFRTLAGRRGPGCDVTSASADPAGRTGSIGRRSSTSKK